MMGLPPHPVCFLFLALLTLSIFPPLAAAAEDQPDAKSKDSIQWQDGPTVGKLGTLGEIKVPAGYRFSGIQGTRKFLEVTHNPPNGTELRVLVPVPEENEKSGNFCVWKCEFPAVGAVMDGDKH